MKDKKIASLRVRTDLLGRKGLTKRETDIVWRSFSEFLFRAWEDGDYVLTDAATPHSSNEIPIRLKIFGGPYQGEFLIKKGAVYSDKDLDEIPSMFRTAVRRVLQEICMYRGEGPQYEC